MNTNPELFLLLTSDQRSVEGLMLTTRKKRGEKGGDKYVDLKGREACFA